MRQQPVQQFGRQSSYHRRTNHITCRVSRKHAPYEFRDEYRRIAADRYNSMIAACSRMMHGTCKPPSGLSPAFGKSNMAIMSARADGCPQMAIASTNSERASATRTTIGLPPRSANALSLSNRRDCPPPKTAPSNFTRLPASGMSRDGPRQAASNRSFAPAKLPDRSPPKW